MQPILVKLIKLMYAAHIGKMNKVTLVVVSLYKVVPRGIRVVEKTHFLLRSVVVTLLDFKNMS